MVSAIERVVRGAMGAARLPAAPTLEWCDLAACALGVVGGAESALVVLCDMASDGTVIDVLATGRSVPANAVQSEGVGPFPALRGRAWCLSVPAPCEGHMARASDCPAWMDDGAEIEGVFAAAFDTGHPTAQRRMLAYGAVARGAGGGVVEDGLRSVARTIAAAASRMVGVNYQRIPWLSERESEVLQYLTRGDSVQEISRQIYRSPHTVQDYVKNLHRKLNASSRGELIALALGQAVPVRPTFRVRESDLDVEGDAPSDDAGDGPAGDSGDSTPDPSS